MKSPYLAQGINVTIILSERLRQHFGRHVLAVLVAVSLVSLATSGQAQSNDWTWMHGSGSVNQSGVYGTLGSEAEGNVPGTRYRSVSWSDTTGNLWLFGGLGIGASGLGDLNDLWKYNPSTGNWTWVSGSSAVNQPGTYGTLGVGAPSNVPGGRNDAVSWTDATGKLWLFGGSRFGTSPVLLNDLWKYDPSTGHWTWMNGSNGINNVGNYGTLGVEAADNLPRARYNAVSWTDATGNLWLFGGDGYGASTSPVGRLNDLWKYDPSTGNWTWMNGSSGFFQLGTYGTLGVAAEGNVPGARRGAVSWTDATGNLWLFGGYGMGASSSGLLNDLWKYHPHTGNWTWMNGSSATNQVGTYGTVGVASTESVPGGRSYSVSWTDATGNLWLFGGDGYGAASSGKLSDLWKYDTSANIWTWIKGSSETQQLGTYGTLGVAEAGNGPGGRYASVSWADGAGNLWMFGGHGYGDRFEGYLNDLWKYSWKTYSSIDRGTWNDWNAVLNQ